MRRPPLSTAILLLALVVGLGGSAVAADRFLITRASQIKPSVIVELRHKVNAVAAAKLSANGAHAIVARPRSVSPQTAGPTPTVIPLTGATWTQHAEALQEAVGFVTMTVPSQAECGGTGRLSLEVFLDGTYAAIVHVPGPGVSPETVSEPMKWAGFFNSDEPRGAPSEWIFEPGKTVSHTLSVQAEDQCPAQKYKIDLVSVDVQGAH